MDCASTRPGRPTPKKRLPQLIDLLRLSRILNRLPTHLSGGEKQRAALARALMVSPAVLLLDEPLSALDPNFREEIRDALKDLHNAAETTFLMVTHDFTDALFLAERAAIMNHGRLEQAGLTAEVFRRPSSLFAAEFVGMKNIFPATFSGASAMVGDLVIPLERPVERPGQYLAVRPEDVVVSREATPINGSSPVKGEVARVADYGFYYSITVKTGGIRIQSLMAKSMLPDTDPREWRQAYVHLRPSSLHLF
jgi:molybdate/tungstate transport system ATP-binding protein